MPPRLILSAFGIHTGGALVLLDALVDAAAPRIGTLFVDARIADRFAAVLPHARVIAVPVTAVARVLALRRLAGTADPGDRLLCFNNLPPLGRSAARTIAYVHAPHLTRLQPQGAVLARERARFAFERTLLWLGRANVDEFWVQTPTTARGLAAAGVTLPTRVLPFCGPSVVSNASSESRSVHLLYPASGAPHKNHICLFQAWRVLDSEGVRPSLSVFMSLADYHARRAVAGLADGDLPHLSCAGQVPHAELLARITAAEALIFPSLAETLGLPLIEAAIAGTPILASERDFVRDVCVPAETFDPLSPRSIADAVRRFLGVPRTPVVPLSSAAFVETIFA